ncbi:hypothetical protein G6F59_015321 [Rhizopus arrhizus]|nr:hypothetical protein G6F59_015321 [Rhizopus arrhizus]
MRGRRVGGAPDQQVIAARYGLGSLKRPRYRPPHQQDGQHPPCSIPPLPAAHATSCSCLRPRPLHVAPGAHYRSRARRACVDQRRRRRFSPRPAARSPPPAGRASGRSGSSVPAAAAVRSHSPAGPVPPAWSARRPPPRSPPIRPPLPSAARAPAR